jgi:LysR family glycine cleavage system transcriptional activator
MSMSSPPLGALRTFEVAARLLSFKRAAQVLHVTPTAVSHQVRLLEDHLGLLLFIRRARSVALTEAGQRLYPGLHEGFDAIARAVANVRPRPARPTLTISATMAFTSRWLVPRVAGFRAREPGLDLSFLAADEAVDLAGGVADVAVRYGRPPWPGLHAELLLRDSFVVVASPKLKLRTPRDLARQSLIHFAWKTQRADTPLWSLWFRCAKLAPFEHQGELSFSDETHAVQATCAGQGVGLLSRALIAEELRSGALVQPFGPELPFGSYYFVCPESARLDERVQKVRRWLRREARAFARLT